MRSFLGLCNVYRRFVPNFTRIAGPLNKRTLKVEPFELEELKKRLTSPPVLALLRYGYRYTLDTDTCESHVGCALLQEQPNGGKLPIGYWSRTLNCSGEELQYYRTKMSIHRLGNPYTTPLPMWYAFYSPNGSRISTLDY